MERPLLVVARWNEDLGWLKDAPGEQFVVQKDVHLPNEGREASSYLWFMATQPIDPDRTYVFLQGNIKDHGVDLSQIRPVDQFTPLGTWRVTDDHNGKPHHMGLPLGQKFVDWFGKRPPAEFTFTAGANFMLPGHAILQYPQDFYADLWPRMGTEWEAPWIIERHWEYIWRDPKGQT